MQEDIIFLPKPAKAY